uniref:Glycosyltransferase n=1 Tax=Linum usitatissimum TaxID=4006 RepID=I2BH63_LINUS|nr:UDP-glycosyltransferase 1 [Linum usitatissimum]
MKMSSEQPKPHVVVMPWAAQGHLNPAFQFSRKLVSKGLAVTLLTFTDEKITQVAAGGTESVAVEVISDRGLLANADGNFLANHRKLVEVELSEFVGRQTVRPCCLVYDSIMPWAVGIARELGMVGAAFFTQPAAVNGVFLEVMEGRIGVPPEKGMVTEVEGWPAAMEVCDLPSFVSDVLDSPSRRMGLEMMAGQFSTAREADWVFCNTFYTLEEKMLNWMTTQSIQMKPVGPTIPSSYVGKEGPTQTNSNYGLSLFNPNSPQTSITQWLDSKPPSSVIYASMGSVSNISQTQTSELAQALQLSTHPFIWVVRKTEQDKLPPKFISETTSGLIVDWCNQLDVLAHPSVGCFVTHCGWNSTLEALCLGVPMVAIPVWADQPTNAKFVADVWYVGARARADIAKDMMTKEEIGDRIVEVMEGESGDKIRRNAKKWSALAKEAIGDRGSSERNVQEFVTALVHGRLA